MWVEQKLYGKKVELDICQEQKKKKIKSTDCTCFNCKINKEIVHKIHKDIAYRNEVLAEQRKHLDGGEIPILPGIDCSRLCGKFKNETEVKRRDIKNLLEEIRSDAKFISFNTIAKIRKKGARGGTIETIESTVIDQSVSPRRVDNPVRSKSPSAVRLCTRFTTDPDKWKTSSGSSINNEPSELDAQRINFNKGHIRKESVLRIMEKRRKSNVTFPDIAQDYSDCTEEWTLENGQSSRSHDKS